MSLWPAAVDPTVASTASCQFLFARKGPFMLLARFQNSLLAATLMLSALVASAQAQTSSGSR
ncbi:MAG: hypothetical protein ACKPJJ_07515, partial [Planctomycetaceae bacterium]